MKKNNTCTKSPKAVNKPAKTKEDVTVGMDLGDKTSRYCAIGSEGDVLFERTTPTTKSGITRVFGAMARCRIALEVGTHSPWVSRMLKKLGHEVIVANPRQVRLITHSSNKNDRLDAERLARLARVDPQLLCPIRHRSEQGQIDLLTIRVRAALVDHRTALINSARGLAKSFGERLPKCDADQLGEQHLEGFAAPVRKELRRLLVQVEALTKEIKECDATIVQIARKYPDTKQLQQVKGVGELIALGFVLTVEDPGRFRSRDVGGYLGLRPKQRQSGERDPQLGISKEGDTYMRKLLVQGAHYILSARGPDTDLKRFGLKLARPGTKIAKKKAVVAVARKLAVLLHQLWVSGADYEPLRNSQAMQKAA